MIVRALVVAAVVVVALAGCDEMMTGGVPRVAGTYTGTLTFAALDYGLSDSAPMQMSVEQSGSRVTATATWTYQGAMSGFALRGTIDETGFFTGDRREPVDPALLDTALCGRLQPVSASLTFSGRRAVFGMVIRGELCGLFTYDATLTR